MRWACLVAVSCTTWGAAAGADPDPVALLRGVEQSRVALHGRLRATHVAEDSANRSPKAEHTLEIEFDGVKRRFTQRQDMFVGKTDKSKAELERQFDALGRDPHAAAKAGLGKVESVLSRSVYDGVQYAVYSDRGGAYIRQPLRGQTSPCFDLRTLGITQVLIVTIKLEDCINLKPDSHISLVGEEVVAGRPTWHVKSTSPKGIIQQHYWVEDRAPFRVHKYMHIVANEKMTTTVTSLSEFDSKDDQNPLPLKVVSERSMTANPKFVQRVTVTVHEADYRARPDPTVFGLEGLDMPPGQMIIDDRVNQVAGYWGGGKVSEARQDALQAAAAEVVEGGGKSRLPWYILAGVGVLIAVVFGVRCSRRRAAPPSPA